MLVRELLAMLNTWNPDAEIVVSDDGDTWPMDKDSWGIVPTSWPLEDGERPTVEYKHDITK